MRLGQNSRFIGWPGPDIPPRSVALCRDSPCVSEDVAENVVLTLSLPVSPAMRSFWVGHFINKARH